MNIFARVKNKKGSLEISINAIVILVMAMVVLGLGLGFIKNLLGKSTENLGKVIANSVLDNPATPDKPVTVDRTTSIKLGGRATIRIGYYNTFSSGVTASPVPTGSSSAPLVCISDVGQTVSLTISSPSIEVPPGESRAFEAILRLEEETTNAESGGLLVCPLEIDVGSSLIGPSTSFYVEIQ